MATVGVPSSGRWGEIPRSVASLVPWAWSRLLFPAAPAVAGPARLVGWLVLLVLPAIFLYPRLEFHLFEPDESRYAEIPREMLARGDWVVPYLQGEAYLDKPPLFYWLVMLSYRLFGVHVWSARLVPALAAHGCVLLLYAFGRRSVGERAAFWGALALSLAPGFLTMARLLVLDGLLTFWVTLTLLAAFEAVATDQFRRGWWWLAAVACGLGVLTKGPVALLLLAVPLWAYLRLTAGASRPGWKEMLGFLAVVIGIVLPWYVAICVRLPEFGRYFFWEHNVVRFVAPFDHQQPVWYYGPIMLAGLLPGTLLLLPFLRFLIGEPWASSRSPALGYFLLCGGWCVLFFSLSGCKLPTYVLPAFPPLCLALGVFLGATAWGESRLTRAFVGTAVVFALLAHLVLIPWYAWYRSPVGTPDALRRHLADPKTAVVCYPRNCDSVAFLLGRDDFRTFRSKEIDPLRLALMYRRRTVVLCTHRHSLHGLLVSLPPNIRLVETEHFGLPPVPGVPEWAAESVTRLSGETAMGLCDLAVLERVGPGPEGAPE